MTLLEKIKINLEYLLGKADPSLYAEVYKSPNLTLKDWQKRWEIFSDNGCGFGWNGVDTIGSIAQFTCDEAYIPEAFFINVNHNNKLAEYFNSLPNFTTSHLPTTLRFSMRKAAERDAENGMLWGPLKDAQKGIFDFYETNDTDWLREKQIYSFNQVKNPYELLAIPDNPLKIFELPNDIQELLKPYHFDNLRFEDCQFLDVSKHLYCEQ